MRFPILQRKKRKIENFSKKSETLNLYLKKICIEFVGSFKVWYIATPKVRIATFLMRIATFLMRNLIELQLF